ncbi:hypothetical protein BIW11_02518 [Tropilaelaps mercedesae]|uniref:Uncharacterized protein n=1 Tax=Tropilaelaps mercedesae TaxID=418985 RepID=A0A1V9Y1V3_9ACAR|nr:hypothetical protein BIW11_02518 [Tropilaelaps mercedesae]
MNAANIHGGRRMACSDERCFRTNTTVAATLEATLARVDNLPLRAIQANDPFVPAVTFDNVDVWNSDLHPLTKA